MPAIEAETASSMPWLINLLSVTTSTPWSLIAQLRALVTARSGATRGMRENPDGFPSSRVRQSRRRCSHSGIWMGLVLKVTPGHAWHLSREIGTAGINPAYEHHGLAGERRPTLGRRPVTLAVGQK